MGDEAKDDGTDEWRCQNCEHHDEEIEFIPSDGNPAPHICPECGSTDVFPVD